MVKEISRALETRGLAEARALLGKLNVLDVADELEQMDTRLAVRLFRLLPKNKAAEVFAHIRKTGVDRETIYTCYVTDGQHMLLGAVTVRTLLLADPGALVAFIPILMDTGGNAGSQSSTLVIRGMALEEIAVTDAWRVWWQELRVAELCGAALVVVNFLRIRLTGGGTMMTLALYVTVILAKQIGCMLPVVAKKLRMDPVVMASPVITTIVETGSLVVCFGLASAMPDI